MKKFLCVVAAVMSLLSASATYAQTSSEPQKKESAVKQEFKNHFKFYGFIRNYFTFDTRESVSGTGDLFYYLPKDVNMSGDLDKNDVSSFRFLALTSRVGVDVSGYQVGKTHFGAKIEADFYAGLSKAANNSGLPSTTSNHGTAQLRLRQAYVTIGWKDLPMSGEEKASVSLKIGQAWHPMAADMPHVFSLEVGAPFGPFSRTPQVTMDANLGEHWTITGSAIWQMQYKSNGPSGSTADYMKYGCVPEMYAGLTYKNKGFLARVGADLLSIKPRVFGEVLDITNFFEGEPVVETVKVSDRITTVSPFFYAQYTYKKFGVKAKTTYGSAGEHMNLMSGYAKVAENEDGSWDYAPLHSSSSWMSLSYGKKWQVVLFLGYMKNLGLKDSLYNKSEGDAVYFCGNGFSNMNQMYRIQPEIVYNAGKFQLGLEYNYTAVQYGDKNLNGYALPSENLHWVANNRIQMIVKFTF